MGVCFVVILENRAARTEGEVNLALSVPGRLWTCFSHQGRSYASWLVAPRYFDRDEDPERWEALRKYLVRARTFLGRGAVYLGNDMVHLRTPTDVMDDWPFFLPMEVPEEWWVEPDVASRPSLANIPELAWLRW